MGSSLIRQHFRILLFLVLSCCAIFWPMLFMDGLLTDSGLTMRWVADGRSDDIVVAFREFGRPFTAYLYAVTCYIPDPHMGLRFLVFMAIILACGSLYAILVQSGIFTRKYAAVIALLALCFPAYTVWPILHTVSYSLNLAIFFLGSAVYLRSFKRKQKFAFWVSLVLMLISFETLTILPFAFMLLAGFYVLQSGVQASIGGHIRHFFKQHAVFILLSIGFLLVNRLMLAPSGAYAKYYAVQFDLLNVGKHLFIAVKFLFTELPLIFFRQLTGEPLLGAVTVVFFGILFISFNIRLKREAIFQRQPAFSHLLLFSLALGFAAYIGYAINAKYIGSGLYTGRYGLLLGLPAGLVFFAIASKIEKYNKRLANGFLMTLLIGFACCQFSDQVLWQNRVIKNNAIIRQLKKLTPPQPGIILFDDQSSFGKQGPLNTGEMNYLLYQAYYQQHYVGLNATTPKSDPETVIRQMETFMNYGGWGSIPFWKDYGLMRDLDREDPAITLLVIRDKASYSALALWWKHVTDDRTKLMEELVEVRFEAYP